MIDKIGIAFACVGMVALIVQLSIWMAAITTLSIEVLCN